MYVGAGVVVSRRFFAKHSLDKKLTVSFLPMGEREKVVVRPWREVEDGVLIPRAYGLQLISNLGLSVENRMSRGKRFKFPVDVKHTGDYRYQHKFVQDILLCAEERTDFLVEAATGKGKTVCSLSVIQKRGRTALVVVDQENLLKQWHAQAKAVLGLTDDQIGIAQGSRCDFAGKGLVIAMVHSLVQREYPKEFYDYFGTVVFDEAHTMGAETFSRAISMFSAEVRFGVSATIDRRDALQKLIHFGLGQVGVSLKDKHSKSFVYYVESDTVYSWYANISPKTGRIITEVSEDTKRNMLLAEIIKWLYESGRDTLVLSDRIEQLEALIVICEGIGIDKEVMGLYSRQKTVWAFTKDPKPKARPVGYTRNTEYTPIKFSPVKKKVPTKQLDAVLERSSIVFATYGMFSKGVDLPRLSGGVDCTGRSRAEQVHGRILRERDGKLVPIWVTIRDVNSYRLDHQFGKRVAEYVASSAEIYQWRLDKGVRAVSVDDLLEKVDLNVNWLKGLKIEMRLDGSYTLLTPK